MTELLKAAILGAIQGISEFLPISSTGHLILTEHILGISQEKYGLSFDAALHLGTLLALLWFFKEEWVKLITSILQSNVIPDSDRGSIQIDSRFRGNDKYAILLLVGTIPAMVLGLLLEKQVETAFRSPQFVAITLIIFSFVLIYVERIGKKIKTIKDLHWLDSLIIGSTQAIALIPGVSRSGITIAGGMWRGLTRKEAAHFAFLLSAPIIAGAGGLKLIKTINLFLNNSLSAFDLQFFAVGMVSAAIYGYLTIKYFLQYLSNKSLYPFIWYRILLGLGILTFFYFK